MTGRQDIPAKPRRDRAVKPERAASEGADKDVRAVPPDLSVAVKDARERAQARAQTDPPPSEPPWPPFGWEWQGWNGWW
jgi:hypothetical protein